MCAWRGVPLEHTIRALICTFPSLMPWPARRLGRSFDVPVHRHRAAPHHLITLPGAVLRSRMAKDTEVRRARHQAPAPRRRHRPPHRPVDHAAGSEPHLDVGVPRGLAALPSTGPGYEVHPFLRRCLPGRRRGDPAQPTPGTEGERALRESRGHPTPRDPQSDPDLQRGPRPSNPGRVHPALQPSRLHSALGYVPLAEYERDFWRSQEQALQSV